MTRETKIALLVGLVFIICFGVILGNSHNDRMPMGRPGAGTLAVQQGPPLTARPAGGEPRSVPTLPGSRPAIPSPTIDAGPAGGALNNVQADQSIVGTGEWRPLRPTPEAVEEVAANTPQPPAQPPQPTPASPPAAPRQMHRVAERDTLYSIATKYYGRPNEQNYKLILEANKLTLASAQKLQVGQELVIPPLPGATRVVDGRALHDYLTALPPGSSPTPGAGPTPAGSPVPAPSTAVRPSANGTVSGSASGTPGTAVTRVASNTSGLATFRSEGLVRLDAPAATPRPSVVVEARTPAAPAARTTSAKTYTVRPHDCLAAIARAQMRDGSQTAVNRLFAANRDKLSSPEKLSPGMVLVIPN